METYSSCAAYNWASSLGMLNKRIKEKQKTRKEITSGFRNRVIKIAWTNKEPVSRSFLSKGRETNKTRGRIKRDQIKSRTYRKYKITSPPETSRSNLAATNQSGNHKREMLKSTRI